MPVVRGQPVGILFFYHVGPRDQTQIFWPGGKCLYPMNYLCVPPPHFIYFKTEPCSVFLAGLALYSCPYASAWITGMCPPCMVHFSLLKNQLIFFLQFYACIRWILIFFMGSPGQPRTFCVAKNDIGLLISLPSLLESLDYKCVPPCPLKILFYNVITGIWKLILIYVSLMLITFIFPLICKLVFIFYLRNLWVMIVCFSPQFVSFIFLQGIIIEEGKFFSSNKNVPTSYHFPLQNAEIK